MEVVIAHRIRQVKAKEEFAHQDGTRKGKLILNKPFWVKLPDGNFWFDFTRKDMDKDALRENIKNGCIYTLIEIQTM